MYYCYWTNCGEENDDPSINHYEFIKLSKCLKYIDSIKYITCGDNNSIDTNHDGAHYIEVGKIVGTERTVYLRLYHHWDDKCSKHGGYPSESDLSSE